MLQVIDLEAWIATSGDSLAEAPLNDTAIDAVLNAMKVIADEHVEASSTSLGDDDLGDPLLALLTLLQQRPHRFRLNRLTALASRIALDPLSVLASATTPGPDPAKREFLLRADAKSRISRRRAPGESARIGGAYVAGWRRRVLLPVTHDTGDHSRCLRTLPVGTVLTSQPVSRWIGSIDHVRIR